MAQALRAHRPPVAVPDYLSVKYAALAAGLFSCSQQGFNIAMGPLCGLHRRLADCLAALDPAALHWEVPPLIRADWIEPGSWHDPPPELWCTEHPAGHILTPRPLAHLLNRLRHHPQDNGRWLLSGTCFRDEDPQRTLPLLRQRCFSLYEYVALDRTAPDAGWSGRLLDAYWDWLCELDLPVALEESEAGRTANGGRVVQLVLPETPAVGLARAWVLSDDLRAAYRQGETSMYCVSFGVERLSLAILARWGVDPARWPDLKR